MVTWHNKIPCRVGESFPDGLQSVFFVKLSAVELAKKCVNFLVFVKDLTEKTEKIQKEKKPTRSSKESSKKATKEDQ